MKPWELGCLLNWEEGVNETNGKFPPSARVPLVDSRVDLSRLDFGIEQVNRFDN
jgi:hypothetical protein